MSKLLYLRISIIFCALILCNGISALGQKTEINYRGFKVDIAQVQNSPQISAIEKAVKRQIEIVNQVGLSEANLIFFKSIPIVMIPASSGTPGVYGGIKRTVFLKGQDLAQNRPILLHELLHAYHHLKITDGFQNAQIRAFYDEAKNKYPGLENEYFLSNPREFFAVTASIYLFGDIPRPPSRLSVIRKAQPEYFEFLENLFKRNK